MPIDLNKYLIDEINKETRPADIYVRARGPRQKQEHEGDLFKSILTDEGIRRKAYTDQLGNPTIGVGFNLNRPDAESRLTAVGADYKAILKGAELSDDQIMRLFEEDVARSKEYAREAIQNFDSLPAQAQRVVTNMAFQLGLAGIMEFKKFRNALELQDFQTAANEIKDSKFYTQVPQRATKHIEALTSLSASVPAPQGIANKLFTDPDTAPRSPRPRPGDLDSLTSAGREPLSSREHAERDKLARDLRVDRGIVDTNPAQSRAERNRRFLNGIVDTHPATGRVMSRPDKFPVLKDDAEKLTKVEDAAKFIGISDVVADAVDTLQLDAYRFVEVVGEAFGAEGLKEFGKAGALEQKEELAKTKGKQVTFLEAVDNPSLMGQWIKQSIPSGAISMSPSIASGAAVAAITAAAGGPLAPATATLGFIVGAFIPSFVLGVGETQEQIKQLGGEKAEAPLVALGSGALIGALDAYFPGKVGSRLVTALGREGAEIAVKKMALFGLAQAAKHGLKDIPKEAITEGLQDVISDVASKYATDKLDTITKKELVTTFIEAAAQGGLFGFVAGSAGNVSTNYIQARRFQKSLDRVNEAVKETETSKIDPETSAEHTTEVLRENDVDMVFIKTRPLLDAISKVPGVNAAQVIRDLGIAEGISESVENDTAVGVPVEKFSEVILGKDIYDKVSDHVAKSEEGVTPAESAEAIAEMSDDLLTALQRYDGDDSLKTRVQELITAFAGGVPIDVMKAAPVDSRAVLMDLVTKVEARRGDISEKKRAGRLRTLDKKVDRIDAQMLELEQRIEENRKQGRPVRRLENRLTTLQNQREATMRQAVELERPSPARQVAEQVLGSPVEGREEVTVRAAELDRLNLRTTKESVKATREAFRKGIQTARKDTKAAQDFLIKAIKATGLPFDRFIINIRNANSFEQLQKASETIQTRIATELDAQRKRELKKAIGDLLKKTKSKGRRGKFDATTQKIFNRLRFAFSKSGKDARSELDSRIGGIEELDKIDGVTRLENQLLALKANPKETSANALEQLALDLNEIYETGRAIRKENLLAQAIEEEKLVEDTLTALGEPRAEDIGKGRQILQNIESRMLGWSGAWWNKLNRIFTSSDAKFVTRLVDDLTFFEENRAWDKGRKQMVERFIAIARKHLGEGLTEHKLLETLMKDASERIYLGSFEHSDGKTRPVVFTRSELRKRAMELRAPELREAMMHEKSNAYTEQIIAAIESELTRTDRQIVNAQFEFYEEYFERISDAYEEAYGVPLKRLEFYSPIRRDYRADSSDNEFLKGHLMRQTLPKSLKERSPNLRPFKAVGDLAVLGSHINEMEYFIAMHDKVRKLNRVFADGGPVMKRIRDNYGDYMAQVINEDLTWFGTRGRSGGIIGEQVFTNLYRHFAFAQLGAKAQIGLKQLSSFATYSRDVDGATFYKYVVEAISNPRKAAKELSALSQLFRDRGMNQDYDLNALANSSDFVLTRTKKQWFLNHMMKFIKWGDKGAILVGGWAHYKAMLDAGATTEEAIRSFERSTVRTQQSSDTDQLSSFQRTSSFARALTMFMSSPNALARAEYDAVVSYAHGRISGKELGKAIVTHHVVIPTVFQFIANGFSWDSDDQLRASLLGAFNGLFVFGGFIEMTLRAILKQETFGGIEGIRSPLEFTKHIIEAMEDIVRIGLDFRYYMEAHEALIKAAQGAGEFTGIPIGTIANEVKGLYNLAVGKAERGLLAILGYSPYTINKALLEE